MHVTWKSDTGNAGQNKVLNKPQGDYWCKKGWTLKPHSHNPVKVVVLVCMYKFTFWQTIDYIFLYYL